MSQYPQRYDGSIAVYGLPTNPTNGSIAVDPADGNLKKYNGTSWDAIVSDPSGINTDILNVTNFDNNSLTDFVHTGLVLSTSNPAKGIKSALLIHQAAINQSFKKTIAVDRKFRNKNLTLSLINRSTAYSSNLTISVYDETNAAALLSSQINTDKQAFVANTTNLSPTVTAIPTTIINSLAIGQSITGAGIPANTIITSINTASLSIVISNNATATATGAALNTSGSLSVRSFSFDVPATCSSLSYTITALPESGSPESYIDEVQISLSSALILPGITTIPKTELQYIKVTGGSVGSPNTNWTVASITGDNTILSAYNTGTGYWTALKKCTVNATISGNGGGVNLGANIYVNGAIVTAQTNASAGQGEHATITVVLNAGDTIGLGSAAGVSGASGHLVATAFSNINISQSFSQAALVQTPDSYLRVTGFNSSTNGSTATAIASIASGVIQQNVGSAIQYLDDSVNGARFVAQQTGLYRFEYSGDISNPSGAGTGFSLNSANLTTNFTSLPFSEKLAIGYDSGAAGIATVFAEVYLNIGDIVRIHRHGTTNSAETAYTTFTASYAGSLKQVNPQLNNKITIPTHQLRFEGASTRGSTDAAVVRFDSQTLTQGDAWDVVNTAANGTVITMKKAGKLSAQASMYTTGTGNCDITKNQSNLTINPTSAESMAGAYGTAVVMSPHATFDVVVGDKIRVISSVAPTGDYHNHLSLSLTETSVPLAISNIWQQNGSGFNPDNVLLQQFDESQLGDFTQTGLNFVIANAINGAKTAQLIHQAAINQSFKQVFQVAPKFRGKNLTLKHDVVSTATSGNLTITVTDETNSTVLVNAVSIPTGSQAITATVTNTSNTITGVSNTVMNSLSVGQRVTGAGIPNNTYITNLNSVTGTITISAAATASGTSIRISDVVKIQKVSFDVPASCGSLSYIITALPETYAETYVDGISIDITSQVLSSTSLTQQTTDTQGISIISNTSIWGSTFTGNRRFAGAQTNKGTGIIQFIADSVNGDYFLALKDCNIDVDWSGAYNTSVAAVWYITKNQAAATPSIAETIALIQYSANLNMALSGGAKLNAGDKIRFYVSSTAGVQAGNEIINVTASAQTTTSTTIPLTTAQLVQTSDSVLRVDNGSTAMGVGSTATGVRRFLSTRENLGSSIQWLDDSINGSRFVIQEAGVYAMSFTDCSASANYIAITKNCTTLTVNSYALAPDQTLAVAYYPAGGNSSCSATVYLNIGDVIRAQVNPNTTTYATQPSIFEISKQGSLKQLNPSSDSKITIPTHQLRFDGSSSKGSTDTAIVKFDSQTITQGDAWDVVNTAVNGTVVTMKKAGKLKVNTNIGAALANRTLVISKNQSSALTGFPTNSVEVIGYAGFNATGNMIASGETDVIVGDKIRVVFDGTPTSSGSGSNLLTLSLTEISISTNFSNVLPQWSQSDSMIRLNTVNGYGSTNTAIRRFSNVTDNIGTAITYADSATLGASFTINEDGTYNISYCDNWDTVANAYVGLSKNTTAPTTAIYSIPVTERLALEYAGIATAPMNIAWQGFLLKGDVIRPHIGAPNATTGTQYSSLTISKVGKPNLTSVDVTSFVNMKTTDTDEVYCTGYTSGTTSGVLFANIVINTNRGILKVDNSGTFTKFTALKDCSVTMAGGSYNVSSLYLQIAVYSASGTWLKYFSGGSVASTTTGGVAGTTRLNAGDYFFMLSQAALANSTNTNFGAVATAIDNSIAAPAQQVSSDTMNFAFKSTAIDSNVDPIGTYNTYTKAANSNAFTIATSRPTQTDANMNTNGIFVTARAYSSADATAASPSRFDIFIGKGLKSKQVDLYLSAGKISPSSYDYSAVSTSDERGCQVYYGETTGILTINAGLATLASNTLRYIDLTSGSVTGYFVFNASKSPLLVTIPNLQPRIAYLSDVKANAAAGGSAIAGSQIRALNTVEDPTGIIKSLVSNQFTLDAGTYEIDATCPAYRINGHRARLQKVSDSSFIVSSDTAYNNSAADVGTTIARILGQFTITSTQTFQISHYTQTAWATNGLGVPASNGVDEKYTVVKVTKIK